MQMMRRTPAGIFKMVEDDTLASMPMAERDVMWPLTREERLVELYRDATELYDLTAKGY